MTPQQYYVQVPILSVDDLPKEAGKYVFIYKDGGLLNVGYYPDEDELEFSVSDLPYSHWLKPVTIPSADNDDLEMEAALAGNLYIADKPTNQRSVLRTEGFIDGFIAARSTPSPAELAVIELLFALKLMRDVAKTYHHDTDFEGVWSELEKLNNDMDIAEAIIKKHSPLLTPKSPEQEESEEERPCKVCGTPLDADTMDCPNEYCGNSQYYNIDF